MNLKHSYKPSTAINTPLKIVLTGVFIVSGLLFTNQAVLSDAIFSDDFESYDLGNLNGQNGWFQDYSSYSFEVVDTDSKTGQQSIYQDFWGADQGNSAVIGTNLATGTAVYFFKIPSENREHYVANSSWFGIFEATTTDLKIMLKKEYKWDQATPTIDVYFQEVVSPFTKHFVKYNVSLNEWHRITLEWRADFDVRAKVDNHEFSVWFSSGVSWTELNKVAFYSWITVFFDNLDLDCDDYEVWSTCQDAGCCWYYSDWLFQHFCVACPIGECASGVYECNNCLTQETCEAEEYCYWFDGGCRYGTGVCGEGLELQFCENQTDCENAGGYWYDDYCWLSEAPDITDWGDYYDQYGDYATPSAWISNVASTTTGFFEKIGGFLVAFQNNFDLQEAYKNGNTFGSAIPTARGYMGILDDFLGGLPFGEFFVFIMLFMLAIGVFRIVKNLIQVLKIW